MDVFGFVAKHRHRQRNEGTLSGYTDEIRAASHGYPSPKHRIRIRVAKVDNGKRRGCDGIDGDGVCVHRHHLEAEPLEDVARYTQSPLLCLGWALPRHEYEAHGWGEFLQEVDNPRTRLWDNRRIGELKQNRWRF